jgi:hypothetical protein
MVASGPRVPEADAIEFRRIVAAGKLLHRGAYRRQVIAKGFDQVAFHAIRISRLVAIGGPQLAIGIGQQSDRLTEQEYRRRHRLFAQPRRVSVAIGFALLRPMLRAFTRAVGPATTRPSVKAVSAG